MWGEKHYLEMVMQLEKGFTYCRIENTMQPTASCVTITFGHKLNCFDFRLWTAGLLQVHAAEVQNGAFFSFFIFRLHTNELGAFVLISLLFNSICVRWRPGMAGIRPKVVRSKWLRGASRRKWVCDKKQCKLLCRLLSEGPEWCRTRCYAFAALCTSGKQPPTVQSWFLPTFKLHTHQYVSSFCIALPTWS